MAKRKVTLAPEHAEYAAKHPPRFPFTCGPHAETYGGGCYNCGWQPDAPRYRVTVWHGENQSVFYVMDTLAPESEQPACMGSLHSQTDADARCATLNAGDHA